MAVQFQFSPPGGLWRHLQIFSSCWELLYGHLATLNIKICPLFKEIQAEQVGCKIRYGGHTEERRRTPSSIIQDNHLIMHILHTNLTLIYRNFHLIRQILQTTLILIYINIPLIINILHTNIILIYMNFHLIKQILQIAMILLYTNIDLILYILNTNLILYTLIFISFCKYCKLS